MKIYYQNILPFPGFTSMAFFGVILARRKYEPLPKYVVNHEEIHAAQAKECNGWVLYYFQYLCQWISAGFNYRNIKFEKEAYANEKKLDYYKQRPAFAWKNY